MTDDYNEIKAQYELIQQDPQFEEKVIVGMKALSAQEKFSISASRGGLIMVGEHPLCGESIYNLRGLTDRMNNNRGDDVFHRMLKRAVMDLQMALADVAVGNKSLDDFPHYEQQYTPGTRPTSASVGDGGKLEYLEL